MITSSKQSPAIDNVSPARENSFIIKVAAGEEC
jgi:hypothetical protein